MTNQNNPNGEEKEKNHHINNLITQIVIHLRQKYWRKKVTKLIEFVTKGKTQDVIKL